MVENIAIMEETMGEGYVPDVLCPSCAEIINIPLPTYAWYAGQVGCRNCQARVEVQIGDWEKRISYRPLAHTKPFGNSKGGLLLEEPKLVSAGRIIPRVLVGGMESNSIPEDIRKAIRVAVQHYDRGYYLDAAVRCRVTLELALAEQGIGSDHLHNMAEQARTVRLVTEGVKYICQAVAHYGGKAAHPQSDPALEVSRRDALVAVTMTANVLRHLYLSVNVP